MADSMSVLENLKLNAKQNEEQIKKLESIFDGHAHHIEELTQENIQLYEQIRTLEDKIISLQVQVDILEQKSSKRESYALYKKFVIAIQDLNSRFHLESKIGAAEALIELKGMRNDDCHYLNRKYKRTDIRDRLFVLSREINSMPASVEKMFNEEFPNLVHEIRLFINTHTDLSSDPLNEPSSMPTRVAIPTDESLSTINEWWQDPI